jgi:hypothetical protein
MVFGKPVVGCAIGGMCEIVEAGGNGLLARPGDAASLEECLARLLADAKLRRAYGSRSRELYEQRFALPLVVERTARFYHEIATRHAASRRPAAATDILGKRLAGVLIQVTGLPGAAAGRAAAALLDPACYPVDYLAAVRRLWHEPEEVFLAGLYALLLNRDMDDDGKSHYLAALRGGATRAAIVRSLALSAEARQAGRPVGWLDDLERTGAPWPQSLPQRAWRLCKRLARAVLGRVARKLRAASSPRNLARYVKRVIYLPWNFQKVYESLPILHELSQQQTELPARVHESITQTLARFLRDVEERQAALERRLDQALRALTAEVRDRAGAAQQAPNQVGSVSEGEAPVPPRILNLDAYKARLGDTLRVNLGGERRREGYLNVDARPGPEVDVIADAQSLPFGPGSLAEIACPHLIDRFSQEHFTGALLPYWKGLLRPGGALRIVCPNWDALVRRLCRGGIETAEFVRSVAWGVAGQGAVPVAFYGSRALCELLRRHGFQRVEVVAEDRDGGLCPEMEIVAHLPDVGRQNALLTAG